MAFDKGQIARIADVLFIGPFMIWFAIVAKDISILNSSIMIALGLGTVIYNLKNFVLKFYPTSVYDINDLYFGLFTVILCIIIYLCRIYLRKKNSRRV